MRWGPFLLKESPSPGRSKFRIRAEQLIRDSFEKIYSFDLKQNPTVLINCRANWKRNMGQFKYWLEKLQVPTDPGLSTAQLMLTNDDLKPGEISQIRLSTRLPLSYPLLGAIALSASCFLPEFIGRKNNMNAKYVNNSRARAASMAMAQFCCILDCRLIERCELLLLGVFERYSGLFDGSPATKVQNHKRHFS